MFWSLLGVKGSKPHVLVNLRENLVVHFFFFLSFALLRQMMKILYFSGDHFGSLELLRICSEKCER